MFTIGATRKGSDVHQVIWQIHYRRMCWRDSVMTRMAYRGWEGNIVQLPKSSTRAVAGLPDRYSVDNHSFSPLNPSLSSRTSEGLSVHVLYIAGFGRSGSTLLDRLLGSTSKVHSGGEIGGVWTLGLVNDRLCSCGAKFSSCPFWRAVGAASFSSLQVGEVTDIAKYFRKTFPARRMWRIIFRRSRRKMMDSAPKNFSDTTARLYRGLRDVSSSPVVVDSSKLATYLVMLAQVPSLDIQVVHLVRDPRAVAHSWQRPRITDPDGRSTMSRIGAAKSAILWTLMNGIVEWISWRLGLPYIRIRYEDLVKDPAQTAGRLRLDVLREADLYFDEAGQVGEGDVNLGVTHMISGNPMRFQQGRTPIIEDDDWKSGPWSRRAMVAAITFPLLKRYGYRGLSLSKSLFWPIIILEIG